jgi:tripartite ATP-independent transporter DctP family solute receptor
MSKKQAAPGARKGLSRRDFIIRSSLAGAAVAATAVGLSAPAIAQGRKVFSIAYDQPHETIYGFSADQFDAKLKELSGGKFALRQFPGAQLGQEPETAQKVRTGDIDLVLNATANTATVVPQAGVLSLHFIFRGEAHLVKAVQNEEINDLFRKMIREGTTGAHSLGLSTLGLRKMYAPNPVMNVGDVKGKKIRVQATKTEDAFFSAYGAVPVHMPFGQVYTSLQSGLVDIAENGADIYLKNKHYEVAPVLSDTNHEANTTQCWISDKLWNSLNKEEQGWVTGAFTHVQTVVPPKAIEADHAAIAKLQSVGVKFATGVDLESFQKIATPIQRQQAQELGPYAEKLLDLVLTLKV